jgi:RNA polymerase sigma factor (sigma-70 family)
MADVTQILSLIDRGDPRAADQLLPLVYDELRKLAAARLSHEPAGQTLQPTALVHEAYLRLVGTGGAQDKDKGRQGDEEKEESMLPISPSPCLPLFSSRGHFFAAAAEAMRRILVESARRKHRLKRGGDLQRQEIFEDAVAAPNVDADLIELDAALDKLQAKDSRKAELVKLRYFAGLTQVQAAQALGISVSTADRDWAYARAWLFRAISR